MTIVSPDRAFAAAPIADAGGDQGVWKNQPLRADVTLDGSGSSDPEGDPVTYRWFGPFPTTSGMTPDVTVPEGTYTVSLIVGDGTSSSEVDTASITIEPCFSISAIAKSGKVQLTWTHIAGTERYDIYRSEESNPFDFEKIGETTSTYALYLNTGLQDGITYLYLVSGLSGGTWCYSDVVSAHPVPRVRRRGGGDSGTQGNFGPVIYTAPITHGTAGIIYNYDVNATHPSGYTLQYRLIEGPDGIWMNAATGLITWTPAVAGSFQVTAEVLDGNGASDIQAFAIIVEALYSPPSVSITADPLTILPGGSSTLMWNSANADSVSIEPGIGSVDPIG
ncbi:MAG: putative Ig domain-containing protein, partial [Bacteroidota bacterium]